MRPMLSDRYTLGIDVGGTHLRLGLTDAKGVLSAYEKHPTALLGNDPTETLFRIISDYICRNGMEKRLLSVCIGFPATVDKKRKTVLNAPNVPGLDGVPVGCILSRRLGLPVHIERDVNLLLLNDIKRLGIDARDVIACYVGTGLGNAIMLNGELFVGHSGVAGELGHIPFGDGDAPCGCGNEGCAEGLVAGRYLAELAKGAFSPTPVGELFAVHRDSPLLQAYVERLGRVIATEINILDPEILLLGGGVINMTAFPRSALEQSIRAHTRKPFPNNTLRILYAEDPDGNGGVCGAGALAWRYVNNENCHR